MLNKIFVLVKKLIRGRPTVEFYIKNYRGEKSLAKCESLMVQRLGGGKYHESKNCYREKWLPG